MDLLPSFSAFLGESYCLNTFWKEIHFEKCQVLCLVLGNDFGPKFLSFDPRCVFK